MTKAAVYIRSAVENAEFVRRQRVEVLTWLKDKGIEPWGIYQEVGAPGSALEDAIRDIEVGKASVLAVWSIDRLSRSALRMAQIVNRIWAANAKIEVAIGGELAATILRKSLRRAR